MYKFPYLLAYLVTYLFFHDSLSASNNILAIFDAHDTGPT